tara:strand:+ start:1832 stop:2173 length:342 start_codon:yes stop_codon:yes gene_type:complete
MNTIDPKVLVKKFASDRKLRNKSKKNYNMSDPMQRKLWWIDKVCYFCYLKHDKQTAQALRIELNKPYVHASARGLARDLWNERKGLEELTKRRLDEHQQTKERIRQKVRNRRQ